MIDKFKSLNMEISSIINKIENFNINPKISSLRRSIENYKFEEVFEEVLNFYDNVADTKEFDNIFLKYNDEDFTVKYRFKTEDSLYNKWQKNLGKSKQLREVCNDTLAIRIVTSLREEELTNIVMEHFTQEEYNKNIDIINFYNKPKAEDDGYRGIHVYFRYNPKSFPVEIQYWTRKDAILNFYTHDIIYKSNSGKNLSQYALKLREWFNQLPDKPSELDLSFIDYWYDVFLSQMGE